VIILSDGVLYKMSATAVTKSQCKKMSATAVTDGIVRHADADEWFKNYPMTQIVTRTWNSIDSHSWRNDFKIWSNDDKDPLQGQYAGYGWYKGCWFFGSDLRNTVVGKPISKIRAYVQRANKSGYAAPVGVRLMPHKHSTRPAGEPTLYTGNVKTVNLDRNQAAWVDVTSAFKSLFESGTAYGMGIYTSSSAGSDYARMTTAAKLEITYEDFI
jgi:hypothetical protein